ncbi:MAG TPA: general stress protein [Segeticoccus sp.]|uniref:general stress protein n=1 Tax=Segeticoccus sp. TaxID=2706531 RepID=UPI002D7F8E3C|nr:general stress protein [Segeticoccus sp.]HET8599917.1 general stress protein [Segeticoccus sp.]
MSAQPNMRRGFGGGPMPGMTLEYPMSLGVYDKYEEAQRAVDYLSDHEFPVQNCMIVGTDLRQVERVTGRLTRARVALGGVLSGVWLGLFVGLIFALFSTGKESWIATVVSTVVFGAIFGLIWALIGYAATQGRRDFTSVSQVVATKYEVLVEHRYAQRARELLTQLDPMRAAQAEADARVRAAQEEARRRAQQQGTPPPPDGTL